MLRGVVAASVALLCCAPAEAGMVVFETEGALSIGSPDVFIEPAALPPTPGTYVFALKMGSPGNYEPFGSLRYNIDYSFYCDGQVCGGNNAQYDVLLERVNDTLLQAEVVFKAPYTTGDDHFRTYYPTGKIKYLWFGAYFPDEGPEVSYQFTITAIPEPATWALLLAGFGAVGGAVRRRPRRAPALPLGR